jgi:cytochrome c-type biogenesis protein CcmH
MATMVLWIILALMTAAAILAVLWPLGRAAPKLSGGSDVLVYKDQLKEIDNDHASGLIGEAEAEAARLEVSRRLLAAGESLQRPVSEVAAAPKASHRGGAALAAVTVLALGPLGLYVALGSPNLPGEPAFARVATPAGRESIASLVGKVETHLAQYPNDGSGWEVLAPVYARLGRFDDAVSARKKALALNGATATREADLGEAETAAANGVVTADAKAAFERALARDAHEPKARYFLGVAAEQDGKSEDAAAIWRSLLADAPAGAPWIDFVRQSLARVAGGAPPLAAAGPNAGDIAAASTMSEDDRRDMVRGMVARLADRLRADGADVDSWLRLVRAYVVLGDRDKAKNAAADAKRALGERPDDIKRIDDLVKGLGLEG